MTSLQTKNRGDIICIPVGFVSLTLLSRELCTGPSDFENKCFVLSACLLSRLFQTGKVQTRAEAVERNVRRQGSSSKCLFPELRRGGGGGTVRLKEG